MNSKRPAVIDPGLDSAKLPLHVAIIMDGNGRWAKKRLLNRIQGHERGADAVRAIVRTCRQIGIPFLTLYAFSTENWQRPAIEIAALMDLLKRFLKSERDELIDKNIRLNTVGQTTRLPRDVQETLAQIMSATNQNTKMTLTLALSYGGRAEIVKAVQDLAVLVQKGEIDPGMITEALLARHLYTRDMPDPDLLIRTSGEMRISNFLLWQIAYTELFVTDTLWPDFGREEFVEILKSYQDRERRFGRTEK